jgi:hypothetical protein
VATTSTRRTVRVSIVSVCSVAILVLFAAVVRQSWVTNTASAEVVRLETAGATFMHPMTSLLAEIVQAESTAVRGETVDAAGLRKAVAAVVTLDQQYGADLQTHQRLTDLSAQIEAAIAGKESGAAAFNTYSGLVILATDLIHQVGDTSHLIHDPDLDSYYLMDAAIVRLPDAVVLAGKAADLVALANQETLQGEDAVKAAVARFGVSSAAEQVSAGLTKTVNFTNRAELGSSIADRLDAFKAAADAFAPPTMLNNLSDAVAPATLAANARRVSAAATPLTHRLLYELQELLDTRGAKLAGQWRFTAIAAGVAGVLALAVLWLFVMGRPRRRPESGADAKPTDPERDLPHGSLNARDLLESEELVHVGRSVRARTLERDNAR